MRKTFLSFLITICTTFLFSLQSCINETVESDTFDSTNPITYLKNVYLKDKYMVSGKKIEWENIRIYKNEDVINLISVPIKSEINDVIEELTFRIDNNKISGHLWKFTSQNFSATDYKLPAHEIMADMTGVVSYVSLDGSIRFEKKIVNGELLVDEALKGSHPGAFCNICHGEIPEVIITVPGTGGTGGNPDPPLPPTTTVPNPNNPNDPCNKAKAGSQKATDLSKNAKFGTAKQGVLNSYNQNGGENGVAFGTNSPDGPLESTGVQVLDEHNGKINNPYPYPVGNIHNHPSTNPPSAGDVYSLISLNNVYPTFQTMYVVASNGSTYALVVTNSGLFESFISNYPPKSTPYGPIFPTAVNDEYNDIAFDSNTSNQQGYENALSYILDKYNAGVALTKMDSNGNFKKINTAKNSSNGSTTYSQSTCN